MRAYKQVGEGYLLPDTYQVSFELQLIAQSYQYGAVGTYLVQQCYCMHICCVEQLLLVARVMLIALLLSTRSKYIFTNRRGAFGQVVGMGYWSCAV